jgi:hypothetical protein
MKGRTMNFKHLNLLSQSRWCRATLLAVPLFLAGCQSLPGAYPPPEERPRTVSEWMRQPRVGDDTIRVK